MRGLDAFHLKERHDEDAFGDPVSRPLDHDDLLDLSTPHGVGGRFDDTLSTVALNLGNPRFCVDVFPKQVAPQPCEQTLVKYNQLFIFSQTVCTKH